MTYRRERSYVPRRMREALSSLSSTMKPDDLWDAIKHHQRFPAERADCRIVSMHDRGEKRNNRPSSRDGSPQRTSGRSSRDGSPQRTGERRGETNLTRSPKMSATRENSRSPRAVGSRSPGTVNLRAEQADLTHPGTGDVSRIRMVCISDLHGRHRSVEKLPAGDILIVAGDLSDQGDPKEVLDFADWIDQQDFPVKIVIAGNHDVTLDEKYYHRKGKDRFKLPKVDPRELIKRLKSVCCYLEDESAKIFPLKDGSGGLRVWGTPWQPKFCDWAFNRPRGRRLARKWERIPTNTDLVVVHGPPLGRGDETKSGERAGCIDLLREIQERVRPQLLVNGHIHEGYGVCNDGVTTFVNAALYTSRSRPIRKPVVIDFIPKRPIDKSTGFVFR